MVCATVPRLAASVRTGTCAVLIAGRWLVLSLLCVTAAVTSNEPQGEQSCKHPSSESHNKDPRCLTFEGPEPGCVSSLSNVPSDDLIDMGSFD